MAKTTVNEVFPSGGLWWARSGSNNQEVSEQDARRLLSALKSQPSGVEITFDMLGAYPKNRLGNIEIKEN